MVVRKRLNVSGPAIAFITTSVFEWKPILTKNSIVEILLSELQKTSTKFNISIISYVIMPSHIHLLLGYLKIENLSKSVQGYKSVTSRKVKELFMPELEQNNYKLWQSRFDDLIIQSEKQLKIKIDYIHNNPVKDGLVERAEDWEYSSAVDWLTENEGLVKVDKVFRWLDN